MDRSLLDAHLSRERRRAQSLYRRAEAYARRVTENRLTPAGVQTTGVDVKKLLGRLDVQGGPSMGCRKATAAVTSSKNAFFWGRARQTQIIEDIEIYVETAPVGAAIVVALYANGVEITNPDDRLAIADGANVGYLPWYRLKTRMLTRGQRLNGDIIQVGSTTAGSGPQIDFNTRVPVNKGQSSSA